MKMPDMRIVEMVQLAMSYRGVVILRRCLKRWDVQPGIMNYCFVYQIVFSAKDASGCCLYCAIIVPNRPIRFELLSRQGL